MYRRNRPLALMTLLSLGLIGSQITGSAVDRATAQTPTAQTPTAKTPNAQNATTQIPAVGATVDDFELPVVGSRDATVKLSEQLARGPVVLVVLRGYPGYQCPLCSRQVASVARAAKKFAAAGSSVVFVYPGAASGLEQHAGEFVGSSALPDPLVMVRDPDMSVIGRLGLRWDAPRETAYPATFVIDRDGKVLWRKVSDSHAGRSDVQDVLAALPPAD